MEDLVSWFQSHEQWLTKDIDELTQEASDLNEGIEFIVQSSGALRVRRTILNALKNDLKRVEDRKLHQQRQLKKYVRALEERNHDQSVNVRGTG